MRTYTTTDAAGARRRIVAKICDPITRRYAVTVDGVEVGRMFADPDDAIARGVEYVRNVDEGRGEYA